MTSGEYGPSGQVRGKPPIPSAASGGTTRAAGPRKEERVAAREATNPFGILIFKRAANLIRYRLIKWPA